MPPSLSSQPIPQASGDDGEVADLDIAEGDLAGAAEAAVPRAAIPCRRIEGAARHPARRVDARPTAMSVPVAAAGLFPLPRRWHVSQQRPWHTLTPALTTVLAVLALILLGLPLAQPAGSTPRGTPYQDLPAFRIWALVGAVSMLTSFAVAVGLWRSETAGRGQDRGVLRWVPRVLYVALAVLVYLVERAFLALDLTPALPAEVTARWGLLFVVGALAATPAVLGLWRVCARLGELKGGPEGPSAAVTTEVFMSELRRAGKHAQRCLVGLTVIVSVGVVTTAVLRKALLAAGYPPDQLPASWLLLHGAFLTALVLLVYLPFFLSWHACVARFVEASYPLPEPGLPTDEWIKDRERLERVLQGNTTLKQNLSAAFGILAPFGGSLLGLVLPGLKGS
jgi:hypothetical protein